VDKVAESRNGLTRVQNFLGAFTYDRWPYGYGIGTASPGTQYVARLLNARELQEFIYTSEYICTKSNYDYYSAAMLTSIAENMQSGYHFCHWLPDVEAGLALDEGDSALWILWSTLRKT
jgi:hypothetical protein